MLLIWYYGTSEQPREAYRPAAIGKPTAELEFHKFAWNPQNYAGFSRIWRDYSAGARIWKVLQEIQRVSEDFIRKSKKLGGI